MDQPANKKGVLFLTEESFRTLTDDSDGMFRRLIEAARAGIYVADAQGDLVYLNHAFVEILGYSTKDELMGGHVDDYIFVNPADRAELLSHMEKVGFVRNHEVQGRKKDGTALTLSIVCNYIWDDGGKIIGTEGIVHDVTKHKELEEAILTEKRKLEEILGFDEKVSSIRKFDQLIDFVVKKAAEILEAEKCSLMLYDKHTKELCIRGAVGLSDEIIKTTRVKFGEGIAGGVAQSGVAVLVKNIEYDQQFLRKNRDAYSTRSFLSAPIKLDGELIGIINVADKKNRQVAVFSQLDLTILCDLAKEVAVAIENVKLYKELNYLTITDPLTQIYNYRHFVKSLHYEMKRSHRTAAPLSLVMIDVDDFKSYNDAYGHLEGDILLKTLGALFQRNLRETDIVCRYAGDEFVVILPDTEIAGANIVAEKLRNNTMHCQFKRPVSLSLGVARFIKDMTRYDFVSRADRALYQAKKEGKNKVCVLG
jgi:diguanylate cyclase (GGDEF)-like protein/PAS domain S-box-containing protein